jgi:hypothetical protein
MLKRCKKFLGAGTTGLLFQAVVQFTPLENSSQSPLLSGFFSGNNLPGFFNAIFTTALSIGAILAVLRLGYAGWLYMGSADMWGHKQEAKDVIFGAIMGLLLLIGIWVILYQINPNLLNLNILQDLPAGSQTPSSS